MADTEENNDTSPRFGRGILIGAGAAALVVGLAVGGVGGFALAQVGDRGPAAVGQGPQPGAQGPMQGQGPRQADHPGPPPGAHGPDGKPPHDGAPKDQDHHENAPQDDTPEG